jgi:anaerobic selenocysteine-containing dehydrogenase
MKKIIRTVCQGCHPECGVLAHVEDGKVIKIEGDPKHPFSRGAICQKGREYYKFTYHTDRVKSPLNALVTRRKIEKITPEQASRCYQQRNQGSYGPLSMP